MLWIYAEASTLNLISSGQEKQKVDEYNIFINCFNIDILTITFRTNLMAQQLESPSSAGAEQQPANIDWSLFIELMSEHITLLEVKKLCIATCKKISQNESSDIIIKTYTLKNLISNSNNVAIHYDQLTPNWIDSLRHIKLESKIKYPDKRSGKWLQFQAHKQFIIAMLNRNIVMMEIILNLQTIKYISVTELHYIYHKYNKSPSIKNLIFSLFPKFKNWYDNVFQGDGWMSGHNYDISPSGNYRIHTKFDPPLYIEEIFNSKIKHDKLLITPDLKINIDQKLKINLFQSITEFYIPLNSQIVEFFMHGEKIHFDLVDDCNVIIISAR